ncbi:MAG TPA: serine hydrolase, partial [Rectinemataceae bacterium]|nr:serine hydrolase [Rectinemataceae bacterium]
MSPEPGIPALDEIAQRWLEAGFFAGAVLRVERGGALLHEAAWGQSLRIPEQSSRLEPGCLFDLASVTKLFTTTAVLRLVSLGGLRLHDPVAELLCPGLDPSLGSRLRASLGGADVASLLAHSSGIHYWYPFYTRRGEAFEAILADVLKAHPRRAEVVYSDLNFMILGRILELRTGLPLRSAMDDLLLRPLGLRRTSYAPPKGPSAAGEFGNRIERRMVADLGLHFPSWRDESRPIQGEADDGNCFYYFGGEAGHA